jgi:hypothetical protein
MTQAAGANANTSPNSSTAVSPALPARADPGEYDVQITPGLRRHRRVGLPEELIQSPLRGGKQACLDVFDGLVCRGRHEVGAVTCQGFTNR